MAEKGVFEDEIVDVKAETTGAGTRLSQNDEENVVVEEKRTGAGTRSLKKDGGRYENIRRRFTAKRLAFTAVFVALSYAVSWLEIPIFPTVTPFLKLDFGNVFILLIAFLFGPIEGIVVCVLKEGLRAIGSSSGGVGEIANILSTSCYILLPSVAYRFRKGIKTVCLTLPIACIVGTGAALLCNRYITFPLYVGEGAASFFADVFWYVAAFNLVKTAAVGILTMLLYKRLSNFLKKMKI